MIDHKTPHLLLPLPHPDNELHEDVFRLRDAFTALDGALHALRGLVASDDVNLDTVQEIVTVLTAAQGDIGDITALLSTKANKTDVSNSLDLKANVVYVDQRLATVNNQLNSKADTTAMVAAIDAVAAASAANSTYARSLIFS